MDASFLASVRAAMGSVQKPSAYDTVYKDECAFSFDTPFSRGGLFLNLSTLCGVGSDFLSLDHRRTGNTIYLHQRFTKTLVPKPKEGEDDKKDEPTQMAIGIDGGFDVDDAGKYEVNESYELVVYNGADDSKRTTPYPNDDLPFIVTDAIEAIKTHAGFHEQTETAVWREEFKESKYARTLEQLPATNATKISPDSSKWVCAESGATENLWLNLGDGHIGSGRQHWDGSGGNGAALRHYKQMKEQGKEFPMVVKLGTITPTGADVYSYAGDEDDMVTDPLLSEHLAHWGINVMQMQKTEKSMAELQIDLNKGFEFDKITEAGKELISVFGARRVGLNNMGNTCYVNSVLQVLKEIPLVNEKYGAQVAEGIFNSLPATSDPVTDFPSQFSKVMTALTTERYVEQPDNSDPKKDPEPNAVAPRMFKQLIGKGHGEFSTGRQQDAVEYFQHLLEVMTSAEHAAGNRLGGDLKSISEFEFEVEERIECDVSGKVRYKTSRENVLPLGVPVELATNAVEIAERELKRQKMGDGEKNEKEDAEKSRPVVPFEACLSQFSADEKLTDYLSSATGKKGPAMKRTRFKTTPNVLAVQVRRYYVAQDWTPKKLDVLVPMPDTIDLEGFRGVGLAEGEVELPEEAPSSASGGDTTATATPATPAAPLEPDPTIVAQLVSMGFSEDGSKRAAVATQNVSADVAMEWVFAHMEDSDFNDPFVAGATENTAEATTAITATAMDTASNTPNPESAAMLSSMGFSDAHASAALKRSNGDVERAADWLFSHSDDLDKAVAEAEAELAGEGPGGAGAGASSSSSPCVDGKGHYSLFGVISHMGGNTGCGHYVAHVLIDGEWLIFNDAKVAKSQSPPKDVGYLYFYRRVV